MTRRASLTLGIGVGAAAFAQTRNPAGPVYTACILGNSSKGRFGHGWDLAFNRVDRVRVLGVSDPDPQGRTNAQRRGSAERSYADYRRMLETERPDIAVIAPRWTEERLAMFRAAMDTGAHVIVEKPFAGNVRDADAMVRMAAGTGRKVMVGHQAQMSESLARIRQLIADGELGELVELRIRGKEDNRAGGEDVSVLGTHSITLMRTFAGNPAEVYARVTRDGRDVTRADGHQGTENVQLSPHGSRRPVPRLTT